MDSLQSRVQYLLDKRNLTQAFVTRRGNFANKAFINDILKGKKRSVRGESLAQLADALDTTVDFLLGQTTNPDLVDKNGAALADDALSARQQARRRMSEALRAENFKFDLAQPIDPGSMARDIPVRGMAVGGEDGDFSFNGSDIDFVRRPPGLLGKAGIYALRVEGESMWPAHRHGALVYVDPQRRPGVGEDAVIQLFHPDPTLGEAGPGFLKRVKRVTPTAITVEQFNPGRDLIFERQNVEHFHRVIPWEEVLGI